MATSDRPKLVVEFRTTKGDYYASWWEPECVPRVGELVDFGEAGTSAVMLITHRPDGAQARHIVEVVITKPERRA